MLLHLEPLLERDEQRLVDGERREQAGVLEAADELALGPLLGREVGDVDAVEADDALVGRLVAADDVEDRRLAGAVRADEAEHLALAQVEATRRRRR